MNFSHAVALCVGLGVGTSLVPLRSVEAITCTDECQMQDVPSELVSCDATPTQVQCIGGANPTLNCDACYAVIPSHRKPCLGAPYAHEQCCFDRGRFRPCFKAKCMVTGVAPNWTYTCLPGPNSCDDPPTYNYDEGYCVDCTGAPMTCNP
jgi:hypothetical protein